MEYVMIKVAQEQFDEVCQKNMVEQIEYVKANLVPDGQNYIKHATPIIEDGVCYVPVMYEQVVETEVTVPEVIKEEPKVIVEEKVTKPEIIITTTPVNTKKARKKKSGK